MCIYIDSKNRALVNSKTGESVYPDCFDDLIAYHAYLIASKHPKQACEKLKDVFKGEKVISEMIMKARGE